MKSAIYKITSILSGKFYVGSAVHYPKRKNNHISSLRLNRHSNKILQNHVNKYGIEDLEFSILEEVEDIQKLILREQYYIDFLSPYFNILPTAGSRLGIRHTAEQKIKQSITAKNITDETRRKMSDSAKKRKASKETREKIGIASRSWKRSKEFCEKMSQINKNRIFKPLTEEHKRKISISNKGKKRTEEAKLNYSKCKKGIKFTEEHKLALRKPKSPKK